MAYNYKRRIQNLIKKYGTSNPEKIARYLNINVRYVDTPNNINGLWKRILRRKFIFVNERLDEWQRMAVIAHELGHILLHPTYRYFCAEGRSYFAVTRHENEADLFSIELMSNLYPDINSNFVDLFLKQGWKNVKEV